MDQALNCFKSQFVLILNIGVVNLSSKDVYSFSIPVTCSSFYRTAAVLYIWQTVDNDATENVGYTRHLEFVKIWLRVKGKTGIKCLFTNDLLSINIHKYCFVLTFWSPKLSVNDHATRNTMTQWGFITAASFNITFPLA